MVTHPDINPVQQGLTSVNRQEAVFAFGDSRTARYLLGLKSLPFSTYMLFTGPYLCPLPLVYMLFT